MFFSKRKLVTPRSVIVLAPAGAVLEPFSGPVQYCERTHSALVAEMQRLRGTIYLEDGAIRPSDMTSGRHISPADNDSWHLLSLGADNSIVGCIRVLHHPNTIRCSTLSVSEAPLARSRDWAKKFIRSVNSELETARRFNFSYVEIGGWALAPEVRRTAEALHTVLSTYALAQLQGGALGITTATERNGSASILRRLGGRPLEWGGAALPPYFDPRYNCGMEVLRFDSRSPNSRYASIVADLRHHLATLPIICAGRAKHSGKPARIFSNILQGFGAQNPVPTFF